MSDSLEGTRNLIEANVKKSNFSKNANRNGLEVLEWIPWVREKYFFKVREKGNFDHGQRKLIILKKSGKTGVGTVKLEVMRVYSENMAMAVY